MENQFDLIENITKLTRMLRRKPRELRQQSHSMHKVLRILIENDGIRAADLAMEMDIRPSSLTDVLKRLEEQEYIYKVKDENDSRVSQIHATQKAQQEFVCWKQQQNEQTERIKSCLTQEEIESFCLVCGKLISFLESEYPESAMDKEYQCKRRTGEHHHRSGEGNRLRGEEGKRHRNKRGRE